MPQSDVQTSKIRKVGNSLGVIVPAAVRRAGGFADGDEVSVQSPRPGLITISCIEDAGKNKARAWGDLQEFVSRRKAAGACWPKGKTFKEILHEARDERLLP